MSERELHAALRTASEDQPLWRAIHALLDGQIAQAEEEATDPTNQLKPPLPAYYAGAAQHLEMFRTYLVEERKRALTAGDEE